MSNTAPSSPPLLTARWDKAGQVVELLTAAPEGQQGAEGGAAQVLTTLCVMPWDYWANSIPTMVSPSHLTF